MAGANRKNLENPKAANGTARSSSGHEKPVQVR
jgi:hypothetical protein